MTMNPHVIADAKAIATEMIAAGDVIRAVPLGRARAAVFVTRDPSLLMCVNDAFEINETPFYIGIGPIEPKPESGR